MVSKPGRLSTYPFDLRVLLSGRQTVYSIQRTAQLKSKAKLSGSLFEVRIKVLVNYNASVNACKHLVVFMLIILSLSAVMAIISPPLSYPECTPQGMDPSSFLPSSSLEIQRTYHTY